MVRVPKQHILSLYALAMLNVAAVMSLRGLPLMAETGLTMIFYLFFASFFFLIPCALVAAELATGWPGPGGAYLWVKEALGSRWGFVAIWLQWVPNVIWYPTVLASLYLLIDNVSVAFFLLSAMTITLYLVMYLLMYAAAIRLRYKRPDVHRSYKVPGGKIGICLAAGIGMLSVFFALVFGFVPPAQLDVGAPMLYVGIVAAE